MFSHFTSHRCVLWVFVVITGALPLASPAVAQQAEVPVAIDQPVAQPIVVALPLARTIRDYHHLAGQTVASQRVQLRPGVAGHIAKVWVEPGATVQAGQLLFQLEARRAQALVDQARAAFQLAELQLALAEAQHRLPAATAAERLTAKNLRDQAQLSVTHARATLELRQVEWEGTDIRAPFAGRLNQELVAAGAWVTPDTTLATLIATDRLDVAFGLEDRAVVTVTSMRRQVEAERARREWARRDWAKREQAKLARANNVPLALAPAQGLPDEVADPSWAEIGFVDEVGYPHAARITSFGNEVDPQTGLVPVRAELSKLDRVALPGMQVAVRIASGFPFSALLIPVDAVYQQGEFPTVLVLRNGNRLVRTRVELGPRVGDLQAIRMGLLPTDWVATEPIVHFKPETLVEPQPVPLTEPTNLPAQTEGRAP